MNIALIHYRAHETDGISLEMDKWKDTLCELGHHVIYIAASEGKDTYGIKELDFRSKKQKMWFRNAFVSLEDFERPSCFETTLQNEAQIIYEKICGIVKDQSLNLMIVNNIASLGLNLPASMAIARIHSENRVRIAYHHHDFYWERVRYANPTVPFVKNILETLLPPQEGEATHFVINRIAREELKRRKNIDAVVVPNVFDFSQSPWVKDPFNEDLRKQLGIADDDIVLLQATRIEDRKAIELAVDITAEAQAVIGVLAGKRLYSGRHLTKDTIVHLVLAGMQEMSQDRFEKLLKHIKHKKVQAHFINHFIASKRTVFPEKRYSLWDTYTIADAVTYPSILEGWGNQFIEAVFAKKPIIAYRYPVFETDIEPLGFNFISLGNTFEQRANGLYKVDDAIIKTTVKKLFSYLLDSVGYARMTHENFAIAQRTLSYETLREILKKQLYV